MNWWNRYKKTFFSISSTFLLLIVVVIVFMMIIGPLIGSKHCTLGGIITSGKEGIHINFVGQIPDHYIVEVGFPTRKRKIICDTSSLPSNIGNGDYCKVNGVFFQQTDEEQDLILPPENLVVTVMFNEKKISRNFYPKYETHYINGEGCPPMQYFAEIEFDLSQ
jgi:hypothetical protein